MLAQSGLEGGPLFRGQDLHQGFPPLGAFGGVLADLVDAVLLLLSQVERIYRRFALLPLAGGGSCLRRRQGGLSEDENKQYCG